MSTKSKKIKIKKSTKYLLYYIIFNILISGLIVGFYSIAFKFELDYLSLGFIILTCISGSASFIAHGILLPNLGTEPFIIGFTLIGAIIVWFSGHIKSDLRFFLYGILCLFWVLCGYTAYYLYIIGP
jgi:hypothetical protein